MTTIAEARAMAGLLAEFTAGLAEKVKAGATVGGAIPGAEALARIGFKPIEPRQSLLNPLRMYVAIPVGCDDGRWRMAPVLWARMPEDCETLVDTARRFLMDPTVRGWAQPAAPADPGSEIAALRSALAEALALTRPVGWPLARRDQRRTHERITELCRKLGVTAEDRGGVQAEAAE